MGKPVALLCNDLHIAGDVIEDFILNWDEMLDLCRQNDVSHCIIGGDLFTDRSSQPLDVLMAVKSCIEKAERLDIDLIIAIGNHDVTDKNASYGYPTLYEAYPNVTVVNDKTCLFTLSKNLSLAIMRYWMEDDVFEEKLEEFCKSMKDIKVNLKDIILYVHEGISGGLGIEAKHEVPKELFGRFHSVLSGHYHNRMRIKGTNIQYIGSSRQANFGEDEDKGYTLLYDDGKTEFIQNQANMRYVTLEVGFDDLSNRFLDKVRSYRDDGYYVRIKLSCTEAQRKSVDKEALIDAGMTKIEYDTEEAVSANITDEDLSKKYDSNEIKTEYTAYCTEKDISSELGITYLNKAL